MGRDSSSSATGSQPTVAELVQRYQNMVKTGRGLAPMASANLEYWLSKKGGIRRIPASHFQNNTAVLSHLQNVHRAVFLSQKDRSKGIVPRIRRNPKPQQYKMTWEDSTYARPLTDLYFGLGGFTVKSNVVVNVKPAAGRPNLWDVAFQSWEAKILDDYNWDHGKSVYIPGWGKIDDADAIRVERAGHAKSFKIESDPWRVIRTTIVGPAQVTV